MPLDPIPPSAGKLVLVVEDEFLIAMDLQHLLEHHGWRVLGPAAATDQALLLMADVTPDLALLDVRQREGLVTPLVAWLQVRQVPVALASACDRPALKANGLDHLPNVGKPADEERLLAILTDLAADR